MLTISRALLDEVIAHARADHPDEACGVIAGPVGSDRPERFIAMTNAERSPTFYRFDSLEQLRVWREMDDRDEEPVVIYHSHTATEAYPSRTDISYASEPSAHYLLVSTREPDQPEARSFHIVDGQVSEEEIHVSADSADSADPDHSAGSADPEHSAGSADSADSAESASAESESAEPAESSESLSPPGPSPPSPLSPPSR